MTKSSQFSPEMQLLVASARKTLTPADSERIVKLCDKPLNWQTWLNLVDRHRVAPLIWHSLNKLDDRLIPEPTFDALQQRIKLNTKHTLFQTIELAKLVRLFEKAGLLIMSFKGPALAIQAYGNLALRHAGDLDLLLIEPSAVWEADRLLTEAGYIRPELNFELTPRQKSVYLKIFHHLVYTSKGLELPIELHWRWTYNPYLFPLSIKEVWQKRELITFANTLVPTMPREDILLYLCVHGANHAWARLKYLCDIPVLMDNGFSNDIEQLLARARQLGVLNMVTQGFMMAHQVLNMPLPPAISAQAHPTVQRLVNVAQQVLREDESYWNNKKPLALVKKPARVLRVFNYSFKLRPALKYKLYYLYLRSTSYLDWSLIRIPDRLFFLYWVLRPFLWLVRHFKKDSY
jgi:hypothetical protein